MRPQGCMSVLSAIIFTSLQLKLIYNFSLLYFINTRELFNLLCTEIKLTDASLIKENYCFNNEIMQNAMNKIRKMICKIHFALQLMSCIVFSGSLFC